MAIGSTQQDILKNKVKDKGSITEIGVGNGMLSKARTKDDGTLELIGEPYPQRGSTPGEKYTNVFEANGKRYGIDKSGKQVEIPMAQGASVVPSSDKQKAAAEKLSAINDRIDSLVEQLRANPDVAGGRGLVSRIGESIQGSISPDTAPTAAHDFESQLTDLKTELHTMKFDKRFSKAAMERMDTIVQGLKLGQPASVAISSLLEAKKQIGTPEQKGPTIGEKRTINGKAARWDGQGWLPD